MHRYNIEVWPERLYLVMNTISELLLPVGDGPKYLLLAQALRQDIRSGARPAGDRLPTVRDLAWRLKVTPGTVARAYAVLTEEGLLHATVGRGTFVAKQTQDTTLPTYDEPDTSPGAGLLDMRSPHLPEVGQSGAISTALRRMSDAVGRNWIDYTTQTGEAPLRAAVCDWLSARPLGPLSPDDVMLAQGGQNALRLVLDTCLSGDRPVILLEELAYPGFRYAAKLARAEVVGVEMDAEGMRPDALEAACLRHAPQVICLAPEAQNPTAAHMSLPRRTAIIAIARRYDVQIIEDECYLAYPGTSPSLRSMAPELVWYVGSLSKSVSAALRFGYAICPPGKGEAARMVAQHTGFALPLPLSALCLDLFETGEAARLRDRAQAEMSARLDIMVAALGDFDMRWQPGIAFVWLRLPAGWRASNFTRMAEEAGVLLRPADLYALNQGRVPRAVRLAVPAHVPLGDLRAGLAAIQRLLPRAPADMAV